MDNGIDGGVDDDVADDHDDEDDGGVTYARDLMRRYPGWSRVPCLDASMIAKVLDAAHESRMQPSHPLFATSNGSGKAIHSSRAAGTATAAASTTSTSTKDEESLYDNPMLVGIANWSPGGGE